MLGQDAIEDVLGIEGPVATDPEQMADQLQMTVFPMETQDTSPQEEAFAESIVDVFEELGVDFVSYEETLRSPPWGRLVRWLAKGAVKTLKSPLRTLVGNGEQSYTDIARPGLKVLKDMRLGDKVERGTTVLAAGDGEAGNLPVDYMGDFRDVTIVTVIDKPEGVHEEMPFTDHYRTALELFAHHMTNVIVGVGDEQWFVYNFNGSHPFYDRDGDLTEQLANSLIPKLAAPIRPPRLHEFEIREQAFDPTDADHAPAVDDLVESGSILEESELYPPGVDLDELGWRNHFYRWAGQLHLDDRTGMSYGFLARQLPTDPVPTWGPGEAGQHLDRVPDPGHAIEQEGHLFATLDLEEDPLTLQVPPVWVMTLRSGCDKTNPDPKRDLVKLGLVDGQMIMATPEGVEIGEGYRPSFDTRVILAHAVGNALVASALDALEDGHAFPRQLASEGMALGHWHGYPHPDHVPGGWHVHGANKPHVSCGTPQAGIFALQGKLSAFARARKQGADFRGDVHIEPQHGTNLTMPTLAELGRYLTKDEEVAGLGNKHLDAYKEKPTVQARAEAGG